MQSQSRCTTGRQPLGALHQQPLPGCLAIWRMDERMPRASLVHMQGKGRGLREVLMASGPGAGSAVAVGHRLAARMLRSILDASPWSLTPLGRVLGVLLIVHRCLVWYQTPALPAFFLGQAGSCKVLPTVIAALESRWAACGCGAAGTVRQA